jgi:hypothetical protein
MKHLRPRYPMCQATTMTEANEVPWLLAEIGTDVPGETSRHGCNESTGPYLKAPYEVDIYQPRNIGNFLIPVT